MIFVNNVEWNGWKKMLGIKEDGTGFKLPKNGVTFKCITKGPPRMHDQMAGGNLIGKIPMGRKGVVIPNHCMMEIEGEMKTVHYAKNAPQKDQQGNIKWQTPSTVFEDGKYIVATDLSEYWFFKNHAYCSDNGSVGKKFFYVEDVAKEAAKTISSERIKSKALSLLWDMTDAQALEIHNIHTKRMASVAEVARLEMKKFAEDKPQEFIDLFNSNTKTMKSIVSRAVEAKIIAYNEKDKFWYWVRPDQKEIGQSDIITQINGRGKDAYEDLYVYMMGKGDGKAVLSLIEGELDKKLELA